MIRGKMFEHKNALDTQQCKELVQFAETHGYYQSRFAGQVREEIRKSQTHHLKTIHILNKLIKLLEPCVPKVYEDKAFVELDREHVYIIKYDSGGFFQFHQDGTTYRGNTKSFLTLQIYLNEDFTGGETLFQPDIVIKPEIGKLIIFDHKLWHSGNTVTGTKYVLRFNALYHRPSNPYSIVPIEKMNVEYLKDIAGKNVQIVEGNFPSDLKIAYGSSGEIIFTRPVLPGKGDYRNKMEVFRFTAESGLCVVGDGCDEVEGYQKCYSICW